jgi:hypothetical protein
VEWGHYEARGRNGQYLIRYIGQISLNTLVTGLRIPTKGTVWTHKRAAMGDAQASHKRRERRLPRGGERASLPTSRPFPRVACVGACVRTHTRACVRACVQACIGPALRRDLALSRTRSRALVPAAEGGGGVGGWGGRRGKGSGPGLSRIQIPVGWGWSFLKGKCVVVPSCGISSGVCPPTWQWSSPLDSGTTIPPPVGVGMCTHKR